MSWQHLHQPCVAGKVYTLSLSHKCVWDSNERWHHVPQVGGLRDTVQPYNPYENTGTGWTFEWADSGKFRNAMGEGIYTLREFPQSFHELRLRGMRQARPRACLRQLIWTWSLEIFKEHVAAVQLMSNNHYMQLSIFNQC